MKVGSQYGTRNLTRVLGGKPGEKYLIVRKTSTLKQKADGVLHVEVVRLIQSFVRAIMLLNLLKLHSIIIPIYLKLVLRMTVQKMIFVIKYQ